MNGIKYTLTLALCATTALLAACNSSQQFGIVSNNQTFSQQATYARQVDVLWVMSDAGSMAAKQPWLSAQVGSFIQSFNNTGLDYQMAVTTMDMSASGEKGAFIAAPGTPVILNSSTPNLVSVLQQRLQMGGNGAPLIRGLESMKAALSAPLNQTTNAGFLRPNSLLLVIFMSDQDDSSTPANYQAFLNSIRPPLPLGGRSWVAEFLGVVASDPLCLTSSWGYQDVGTQFINLATASTGASASICSGNLQVALTSVKERILEVSTAWQLSRQPDVSSIRVVVNGNVVPQDANSGWTYDSASLTIQFHGSAIPAVGSQISVTFNPATLG